MSAPTLDRVLTGWSLSPALIAVALAAAGYALLARRTERWPPRRTACWMGGLAAIAVALGSGVDAYDGGLLSLHMVQHLLLMVVAAPLLLAGAPLALMLRTLPRGPRRRVADLLGSRALRAVTHPLVGWTAFAGANLILHLTPLYELAIEHPFVHVLEHAVMLSAALLFWLPLVGAAPLPHRMGVAGATAYAMTAMPPMTVVALWLASTSQLRYGHYAGPAARWGIDALADQQLAGGLMFLGGLAAGLLTVAVAVWPALVREERRATAREAYEEARA